MPGTCQCLSVPPVSACFRFLTTYERQAPVYQLSCDNLLSPVGDNEQSPANGAQFALTGWTRNAALVKLMLTSASIRAFRVIRVQFPRHPGHRSFAFVVDRVLGPAWVGRGDLSIRLRLQRETCPETIIIGITSKVLLYPSSQSGVPRLP